MARRTILTPELRQQLIDTVAVGNYAKTAAAYCGIGYSTLLLWQQRGRAEQERIAAGLDPSPEEAPYLELLEQMHQAETRAQVAAVAAWRGAFATDWRAAATFLARTRPAEWAERQHISIGDAAAEERVQAAVDAAVAESLHLGTGQPADPEEDEAQVLRMLGEAGP